MPGCPKSRAALPIITTFRKCFFFSLFPHLTIYIVHLEEEPQLVRLAAVHQQAQGAQQLLQADGPAPVRVEERKEPLGKEGLRGGEMLWVAAGCSAWPESRCCQHSSRCQQCELPSKCSWWRAESRREERRMLFAGGWWHGDLPGNEEAELWGAGGARLLFLLAAERLEVPLSPSHTTP